MTGKKWGILIGMLVICFWSVISIGVWRTGQTAKEIPAAAEPARLDTAAQYRLEREQLRSMQKSQLNDIIHDEKTEPEITAAAQRQLMDLLDREETEKVLEGMLSIRGFENSVVAVSGNSVNAFIQSEMITKQESIIIMDMICRQTGIQSGNIKIIPVN